MRITATPSRGSGAHSQQEGVESGFRSAGAAVQPAPAPVRILSDLHLGHSGTLIDDVRQLTPLLEGAGTVIFNGDTIEERCSDFRERGKAMLAELNALCAELGVRPIYLSGNHDPDTWELSWVDLCARKVFVSHGHAIIKYISPWSRRAGRTSRIIDGLWEDFARSHGRRTLEERMELTRQSCHATAVYQPQLGRSLVSKMLTVAGEAWPPSRPLAVLRTWINMPQLAREFVDDYRPDARFFVMGHTHFPGIWTSGHLNVINTGAFFLWLNARVVEISETQLTVHKVARNRSREFVPGRGFRAFSLPPATASP